MMNKCQLPAQHTVYNYRYQIDIRTHKLRLLTVLAMKKFQSISVNSGGTTNIYHNVYFLLRLSVSWENRYFYVYYQLQITM